MNYQQTYDPMQASAMRQQQNLGLAQSIKGGLGAIQQGLQENAVYKQYIAKNKSEEEAKSNYLEAIASAAQQAGIDISKNPEYIAAQGYVANKEIPSYKFMEMTAGLGKTVKDSIEVKNTIASQSPEARGFRQPQPGTVGAIDPMAQPQQPGGKVDDFTARLLEEQQTGKPYDQTVTAATRPFKVDDPTQDLDPMAKDYPEQLERKNLLDQQRSMIKMFEAKANAGSMDTGESAKFTSDMMAMAMKDKDIEIEKLKSDREYKKALNLKAGEKKVEGYNKGFQPTKDGEVQSSWDSGVFGVEGDRWGVGPIDPSMDKEHAGRTGGGSGIKKDTDLAALYDKFVDNQTKFYSSEGGLKDESFEGAAKQATQRTRIVGNALTLQNKVGSDVLDSKTAVQKAEEFVSIKDALKSVIGDQEGLWNKENPNYPEWKSMFLPNDTPSVLKNADRLFYNLKTSNPGAYNKIVLGLQNGNSLYTILNAIEAQGIE